jgi:PhzF family phenazine biosynthesis protein
MKVWTVDAFANQIFSGNPAAVIPVEEFPLDEVCQKIAAEFNLSETAFVKPIGGSRFHLRWFTPKVEIKLCGHATLATAHVIFQEHLTTGELIEFDSLSGILKVRKSGDKLTLDFPLQSTGAVLERQAIQQMIGTEVKNVVQACDDIIVELPNENEVRKLDIPASSWAQLECRGVIVTAKGSGDYDFVSRFFAPRVGVDEDPVTGSAHCKLAHYWKEKLGKNQFTACQASRRGGVIEINVVSDRVLLTGSAVTVIRGDLQISSQEIGLPPGIITPTLFSHYVDSE